MDLRRLIAWMLLTSIWAVTVNAAEDAQNSERTKEPPQAGEPKAEPKKKQESESKTESKTESGVKQPAEDKKAEEPPQPKVEEPAKKPVTSLNLTIKLALMADPTLFPYEIEVEMDHGKAVLTGSVPTEEDKTRAAEVARKIEGVESVLNKLSLAPALRTSLAKKQDETIAHFVRERLARSETLKAVGFDVKSESGIVHLSGKTRFQVIALEAAEAARQVPGVRAVNTDKIQIVAKE